MRVKILAVYDYMTSDIERIKAQILEIHGQRVMLDCDLAKLYGVETSQLKRAVKRNIERFEGEDFMFEITHDELLRCQIGTSSWGGSRYGAFAFTELGVAMLSSVLRSPLAIAINRSIMRAFVEFRRMANVIKTENIVSKEDLQIFRQEINSYIDEILHDQNEINELTEAHLEVIDQTLAQLQSTSRPPRRPILGFRQTEGTEEGHK